MLHRVVFGLVLAAAVASPHAQPPARPQPPERGMLAVLRGDGIILPFAIFKGDSWSKPWPYPTVTTEVPITLASVPGRWWGGEPFPEWAAVLSGGETRPLRLIAPVVVPVCEERRIGVRTDYRSRERPAGLVVQPYPKDGLAVTSGVGVEPIEAVAADSDRQALTRTLANAIHEAEEETIRRLRGKTDFEHPFQRAARRGVAPQLEAWYRAPMDAHGWTLSWIEAVKRYPPGPEDQGCGLETIVSGWVQRNALEPSPRTNLTARVTYCDREGITYMLPFGLVRTRSRLHWVYQLSGTGQEWYQVMQVSPGRLKPVVEYFGGGGFDCVS